MANLHAHADRAFTVDSFRPRSLADAIMAAAKARAAFTAADVRGRAKRLFERSISHGVTRLRTHTDVDPIVELRSMQGVLAAKKRRSRTSRCRRHRVLDFAERSGRAGGGRPPPARNRGSGPDFSARASMPAPIRRARSTRCSIWPERTGLPVDLHLDEHLEPHRCSRAWSPMRLLRAGCKAGSPSAISACSPRSTRRSPAR